MSAQAYGFPDDLVNGKQWVFKRLLDHTHFRVFLEIAKAEKPPLDQMHLSKIPIPWNRAHHFHIGTLSTAVGSPSLFAIFHHQGDLRKGLSDAQHILIGQTVIENVAALPLLLVLLFGRLDGSQNDVLASKFLDLLLRLEVGAFPNGEHGDDRGHSEHHAHGGQDGTQTVQHETFEPQCEDMTHAGRREGEHDTLGILARQGEEGLFIRYGRPLIKGLGIDIFWNLEVDNLSFIHPRSNGSKAIVVVFHLNRSQPAT